MGLYIIGLAIVVGFAALLWRQYRRGSWQRRETSFFVDLIALVTTALFVGVLALVQLQSPPPSREQASAPPTPTQRPTTLPSPTVDAAPTVTDSIQPILDTMTYTVQEGDTLESIATAHGIAVGTLRLLNEMDETEGIEVGQRLLVPDLQLTPTPLVEATPTMSESVTISATLTPPAEPTPTAATRTHTIQEGDTLLSIAAEYEITVEALKAANPELDETRLQIGQLLQLPAPGETPPTATPAPAPTRGTIQYTVQSGDTLSGIAKRFGVTTQQIIAATPGLNPDRLSIGQTLNIPDQPLP